MLPPTAPFSSRTQCSLPHLATAPISSANRRNVHILQGYVLGDGQWCTAQRSWAPRDPWRAPTAVRRRFPFLPAQTRRELTFDRSGLSGIGDVACGTWVPPGATIALGPLQNTTLTESALAFEWYILAEWATSDLGRFSPTSLPLFDNAARAAIAASATATQTSTASHTSHSVAATATGPSASHPSGGLSTGAKAGIGVGAAIGGLLVIGAIVIFALKSRKQRQRKKAVPEVSTMSGDYRSQNQSSFTSPHMSQRGESHNRW